MIIAIDGPSASGKSTVARGVGQALRLPYLDTGSMYRAVTRAVLNKGVDVNDARACERVARSVALEILGPGRIAVDGRDVTKEIRSADVTAVVSTVASHPGVRRHLVEQQRTYTAPRGGVVEGRDIGTVVFPGALLKVFLTASSDERARRRDEEGGLGEGEDLARRDRLDSARKVSPLAPAADAVMIDTTGREPGEVIDEIVGLVRQLQRARQGRSGPRQRRIAPRGRR